jgi:hypothetical protein
LPPGFRPRGVPGDLQLVCGKATQVALSKLFAIKYITVTGPTIAGAVLGAGIVILGLAVGFRAFRQKDDSSAAPPDTVTQGDASLLYGRIVTVDGAIWQGRLRWGGDQEAFWGDYFNGEKKKNPWTRFVPADRLPTRSHSIEIFGWQFARRERPADLSRPFMARFGDIARIEATARDVRVTLKSGSVFDLDRFSASDFDDGVRVWDNTRGAAEIDAGQIRSVDLLAAPVGGRAPHQLHGTVRTWHSDFSGFLQWNRKQSAGTDELRGHSANREIRLRFDAIRSIERRSDDSSVVKLLDGGQIVLSGASDVGKENRGVYVDDPRYGRVLIPWESFVSVDFTPGDSGPTYEDFPRGAAIAGSVTTRDGRLLSGRLVYDIDESEITETLDAPCEGVDYTIPFGLIQSIAIPASGPARVTLWSGEELRLERRGDLAEGNGGILVFVSGGPKPEYVPWTDAAQIDLTRPAAMYPPVSPSPSRSRSRSARRESVRSR